MDIPWRDVGDVVKEICQVSELGEDTRRDLQKAVQMAHYVAPELQAAVWREVGLILDRDIGQPKAEWEKKVQRIMAGAVTL